MDFPSFSALFRIARDEVLGRNSSLTRAIVDRAGSDANALTAAGVAVGDAVVGLLIRVNAALFLDTAKGPDLDRLVFDRYQLLRKPASPAVGEVQFTTLTPALSSFSIPAGTLLQTVDGIQFVTTVQMSFSVGSSGPVTIPVQSVLAGLSQQARAGTITGIVSTIPGAPGDLAVTNALATAGADDEERDQSLRDRAKRFYKTSKRGTLAAIEAGALAAPGVRTAHAFEIIDGTGVPARLVEVVVADAFTEQLVDAGTLPGSYQIQAQNLRTQVQSSLEDVRAAGIQVVVTVGVVTLLGISLNLRFRGGADVDAATSAAKAELVDYVNSLAPGATFVYQDATNALRTVPGLIVLGGEIASPPGDVVPTTLEVLRTSTGLVIIGAMVTNAGPPTP